MSVQGMCRILFVCVANSCRSQMAEGFTREYGAGIIEAYSAGTHPSGAVDPRAVEVMNEAGIDISGQISKGFDALPVKEFDLVIGMGCGDSCPLVPSRGRLTWDISDPKGADIRVFRAARDDIRDHVLELIEGINKGG